jgi:hypothetical protein
MGHLRTSYQKNVGGPKGIAETIVILLIPWKGSLP